MIPSAEFETCRLLTTDGEIALINLESARQRSWGRFSDDPHLLGVADLIVEQEQEQLCPFWCVIVTAIPFGRLGSLDW